MIAITTQDGKLRICAELEIPNGKAWNATRMTRLMAHIEQFVFAAELADKPCDTLRTHYEVPRQPLRLQSKS